MFNISYCRTWVLAVAGLAFGLSFGLARPVFAQADTAQVAPSGKIFMSDNESNPLADRIEIELPKTMDLTPPSFLTDLNKSIMNQELYNQMDARYMARLRDFTMYRGFYTLDQDKPFSPFGITQTQELQLRSEMADTVKSYILVRAIPEFLKKKVEKNFIVAAATQTMQKVSNFKVYSQKTEEKTPIQGSVTPREIIVNPWEVTAGLVPSRWSSFAPVEWDAWATYANGIWNFTTAYNLGVRNTRLSTSYRKHRWGPYTSFQVETRTLSPGVAYYWNPTTETRLTTSVPLRAPQPLQGLVYALDFKKTF